MSGTVSIETNDIEWNYLESSSNEIAGWSHKVNYLPPILPLVIAA
jgi:hypothetical protein